MRRAPLEIPAPAVVAAVLLPQLAAGRLLAPPRPRLALAWRSFVRASARFALARPRRAGGLAA
ncbi:MAG TPA: hypothetical protein VLW50_29625 [Streptosporangiaceae bacterium]|nr:hypothetical protein [Streptosporangiaceae bacterium]